MELFQYTGSGISVTHTLTPNPQPEEFFMHTHTHAELYVFLSGKGIYHIEGSEYSLEPGDILLMRPGESHYIEIDPDVSYERIVVWFNTDLFSVLDHENALMLPLFERKAGTLNMYRRNSFRNEGYLDCLFGMVNGEVSLGC